MNKLFLTTVIFLLGGVYFNTFAQEELNWKIQQYQKAEQSQIRQNQVQYAEQYQGEEFLALQTEQKNPETSQQKDPESQTNPPILESMEEDSMDQETQQEESILLKPQQISPDRSQSIAQPGLKPIQKPEASKQNVQEDDSVLEFNFLYFIIHKFKLSDILE